MTAHRLAFLLLPAILACLPGPLLAQDGETPQQQLYQDALQSLAEGRKNDASKALVRLIEQEPKHAGAWLDLALIQCSLGHAEEAERLFANIETLPGFFMERYRDRPEFDESFFRVD